MKLIKKFLGKLIRFLYRIVYRFIPCQKDTILFISFHGRGYSDNPMALHQYITNHHEYQKYRCIYAIKNHKQKNLKIENAKVYKLDYRKALKKFSEERIKFDLVLLDPPYGKGLVDGILEFLIENEMLNEGCIIMVEELKEVVFKAFEQINLLKKNDYGITALNVFKYQG